MNDTAGLAPLIQEQSSAVSSSGTNALEQFRIKEIERKAKEAAYAKEWRQKNAEKYAIRRKAWEQKNRERLNQKSKEYYANHIDERRAQRKESNAKHADKIRAKANEKYQENKESILEWHRNYTRAYPEKQKTRAKKYQPRRNEVRKIRRANDPVEKIKDSCRNRVRDALLKAGIPKYDHTFDLIGCTPDFFKAYLEAKFNRMMNWSNYGTYWEIDHIVAVSKFNLEKEEELFKAFHYSNCQPLEVPLNRSKCDRETWSAEIASTVPTVSPTRNCNPPTTSHKPHHSCKIPV